MQRGPHSRLSSLCVREYNILWQSFSATTINPPFPENNLIAKRKTDSSTPSTTSPFTNARHPAPAFVEPSMRKQRRWVFVAVFPFVRAVIVVVVAAGGCTGAFGIIDCKYSRKLFGHFDNCRCGACIHLAAVRPFLGKKTEHGPESYTNTMHHRRPLKVSELKKAEGLPTAPESLTYISTHLFLCTFSHDYSGEKITFTQGIQGCHRSMMLAAVQYIS